MANAPTAIVALVMVLSPCSSSCRVDGSVTLQCTLPSKVMQAQEQQTEPPPQSAYRSSAMASMATRWPSGHRSPCTVDLAGGWSVLKNSA